MATADAVAAARLAASPVFASLRGLLQQLPHDRFATIADLNAIAAASGVEVRFVEQAVPASALEYERRIALHGEIATRPGSWHDLFNVLVWCRYPAAKQALNRAHVAAGSNEGARRGRRRDVATLFDESGVIVACADAELAAALYAFRWHELFREGRDRVRRAIRFAVFGHGLLEKALAPYKSMTGHALVVPVDAALLGAAPDALGLQLDRLVAARFGADTVPARLTPLPILGIPDWCEANADPTFYDDREVFRSGRVKMR